MAKHSYEGRQVDGSESEGHKQLNKEIRGAFQRGRVTVEGELPKKREPKREAEKPKSKWDNRHIDPNEGIDGYPRGQF